MFFGVGDSDRILTFSKESECCVPVFTGIRNFRGYKVRTLPKAFGDEVTVLGIVFFENLWGSFNFFWRF